MRSKPVDRGDTPTVAGHQSRETILGHRSNQIVANRPLVLQKFNRDHGANGVATEILGIRRTTAVSVEARDWVTTAGLHLSTQDVALNHRASIAHSGSVRLFIARPRYSKQDDEVTRTTGLLRRLSVVTLLVASGATITSTAGSSMNPLPIPLRVVQADDSKTVFVVSTDNLFDANHPSSCGSNCYQLHRTTDDGAHFTVLELPPVHYVAGTLTGNLDKLIFANVRDGYALTGVGVPTNLYVTHDGAATWHHETIAKDSTILSFAATRDVLYAVIARCTKSFTCTHYQLARSSLTAHAWTIVPLPAWTAQGVGMGAMDSTVWLSQQTATAALLWTSRNMGSTFVRTSAPPLLSVNGCQLTATSTTSLWADCPTGMQVSFLFSSDSGSTWNRVPSRQFFGTGGGNFDPVSRSLAYLAFGSGNPPGPKNFYRITNDGLTVKAVGRLPCQYAQALVFTDSLHGFAACQAKTSLLSTVLLHTSDGGATWKRDAAFDNPF
jgi:hypothetical protein